MPETVAIVGSGLPVADLEVVGQLGRGAQTAVYRVRRGGTDYALKLSQASIGDDDRTAAEFYREAAALARIGAAGVPAVHDVGVTDGRPYLVLEFIDGRTLAEVLAAGPLTEERLVAIAGDVAAALAAAHRAGVVHRDVKPANLMVTGSDRAYVIDFGLAVPHVAAADGDGPVVGTFDYSAPEQTGMLNRTVDGRSDLYALGVVLFECATGVLPFAADSVGEMVSQHATVPAPDPRSLRPGLSAPLAGVILRLLAKDPDDRFASAADLLAALAGLPGARPPAAGVTADAAPPLAGRDDERAALAARLVRARAGRGGLALLTGSPGEGKSALADDLARTAAASGVLMLSGKCDADSALPLAALRGAVEQYLAGVAARPPAERAAAVERIRAAAGVAAGLLRPLSPTLAVMLDAPVLVAEDRHEQFAGAVASFLVALVRGTGGLLVLDDVQWLDESSRAVVRRLAEEVGDSSLLVVATARDDATSGPGLRAFERAAGPALDLRVGVGPLADPAIARLVTRQLGGPEVGPDVIAELSARGQGNPFTILEYLRSLIDVGALRPSWGRWLLDVELLQRVSLPTDVLDLVLARVSGLAGRTREVLTVAAAIGTVVEPGLLAEVAGPRLTPALVEAADRGLVHPRGTGYAFVHDRVREALLSALTPADRRALHQRIATVLDRRAGGDAATVYATARHYANGETDRTPERVYATGRAAGQLALLENAPDAALTFLEAAAGAARAADLPLDNRFREALSVANWSTGRIGPAREHLEAALTTERDPLRRAALLLQLSHVLRTGWELTRAIDCARQGLAELGAGVPAHPVALGLFTLTRMVRWLVTGSRPPAAEPVRGEAAARLELQVLLCRAAVAASAIDLKHGQVVAFALRAAPHAHRLGPTSGYVSHLSGIGSIAGSIGLRGRRDRIYRLAKDLATDLGDPTAYANAAWYEAFSKVLGKEILTSEWADVSESHRRYLQVDFYTNILLMRCRDLVQRGYATEALAWHDRGRSRISDPTADAFPGFDVLASMAGALLGRGDDAPARLAARSVEPLDIGHGIQFVLGAVQTALEHDELGEPFERAVAAFAARGVAVSAIFTEYRMIYAYIAFARLTQVQRAGHDDPSARAERLAVAKAAVRDLGRAANSTGPAAGPLALTLLRGYDVVARASLAQLSGRDREALQLLARGEAGLAQLDAPLVDYEAARVRARAVAGLGHGERSGRHVRTAHELAVEHGWARRAHWLRSEFGTAATAGPRSHRTRQGLDAGADPFRRRLQALQQVSTAAVKVRDPRELARVALDETLQILGAERAILLLAEPDGSGLQVSLGRDALGNDITELGGYATTLVNRVAAERRPLVVTGSEEGAALGSRSAVVYGLRSIISAPLELDERLIGVVYLDSRVARGVFTDADVDILTAVTSTIAVSLETARAAQLEVAVQVAREQRDTAELLHTAMNQLSSTNEPDRVLQHLLDIMARALPADRACVVHLDHGDLTVLSHGPVDRAGATTGVVAAGRRPGHGDAAAAPAEIAALLDGARSWVAVPLPAHGHGHGVLVAGSPRPGAFTRAHQDVLSAVAGMAGTAYDNARLFATVQQLAVTDGLTGASNRRHLIELAGDRVGSARRDGRPLAAMMVDIDHFKAVNDTFGHAAGDEVIRAVADVLRRHVRRSGDFGRYGGEEFAVVRGGTADDARAAAEGLRAAVEDETVAGPDGPIRVTISVGLAELRPGDTVESLLDRADQALYDAKRSGRNRVSVA